MIKRWRLDPGLLAVALLATLAAWPFLTRASLPLFTDAELHVFRAQEILSAWRAGTLYLRWAPNLFYGYGYPVFNYYSPLTYYLAAAYGALAGVTAGLKLVLVGSIYLGACGMYLFAREQWSAPAGVAAAAAFSFAPYLVYIDPHARGDAPETLAIALAPLLFWRFARLRRTGAARDVVPAAVCLAALIFAHNLMAVLFFGMLLAWLAWDVWLTPPAPGVSRWPELGRLAAAIALGLGLAACLWLPAALERNAVQFRNVAGGVFFDFRRHFIDVYELFAPARRMDLGATELAFNYSLGLAQTVLGALGLLSLVRPSPARKTTLFFGLTAVILVYLMLPVSTLVWEAVPPMAFLQFPTRLLGPAALAVGLLAGAALQAASDWARPGGFPLGAVSALAAGLVCVAAALPLLNPAPWADFGSVNTLRLLETELSGRHAGTTSANDFLPVGVAVVPKPQPALVASYRAGQPDKINQTTLPAGTQVQTLSLEPQRQRYLVTGAEEFTLRPYTFYFPGWTAYVDDQPVPIEVADPDGWITFRVPAGRHEVRLQLNDTPPRLAGWILSGLSLAGLLVLVWRTRGQRLTPALAGLDRRLAGGVLLLALAGMALRLAADQFGWWRVHSTGRQVLVAEQLLFAPLERNLALLAYDLPRRQARPGSLAPVTLYWKKLAPLDQDLRVFVHFIGPDGQLWGQSDKWNPADFPTRGWPLDRYVRDLHRAELRPDAPPGQYQVVAGLWDGETNVRMRVLDAAGQPTAADSIVLTDAFTVLP